MAFALSWASGSTSVPCLRRPRGTLPRNSANSDPIAQSPNSNDRCPWTAPRCLPLELNSSCFISGRRRFLAASRGQHRHRSGEGKPICSIGPDRTCIGPGRNTGDHGHHDPLHSTRELSRKSSSPATHVAVLDGAFDPLDVYADKNSRLHKAATASSGSSSSRPEGSVLGAIALITGTSVGAGMLAIPSETAPVGFLPSASLLVGCWAFLTLEAFLIAEVNIALMKKRDQQSLSSDNADQASEVISLRTMAEETLGPVGGWVSSATYVFLSYTLVVAYVAKAADILVLGADTSFEVASGLFVLALGGLVYAGNTQTTDWANRFMTGALLVLFAVIVSGGTLSADWSLLSHQNWSQAPGTLPILFLSLVFHDLIPVLCTYLGGDLARVRTALALGGAGPLAMFLVWDAVALSLAGGTASGDPLDVLMSLGGSAESLTVEAFSLLAVMTSFIGTALGMSEFFIEQLGRIIPTSKSRAEEVARLEAFSHRQPAVDEQRHTPAPPAGFSISRAQALRAAAFALVLLPPWAMACSIPDAFFTASEAAGAYGMTVLYGIFPPLMFWKLIQAENADSQSTKGKKGKGKSASLWSQPAGGFALASMAACAFSVMLGQAMLDTSSFRASLGSQGKAAQELGSSGSSVLVLAATPVSGSGWINLLSGGGLESSQSLSAPPLVAEDSTRSLAPSA